MPDGSLTDRELAAVLAGLRLLQWARHRALAVADIDQIATDSGRLKPLNNREIDKLCEALNVATEGEHVSS